LEILLFEKNPPTRSDIKGRCDSFPGSEIDVYVFLIVLYYVNSYNMFDKFKKLKKKDIGTEAIVDSWLLEYFNTTMEEVSKVYTKNEDGEYSPDDIRKFYKDLIL